VRSLRVEVFHELEVERRLSSLPPPWIVVRLPKLISPAWTVVQSYFAAQDAGK